MATKKAESTEIQIAEVQEQTVELVLVGRTPLIINRLSEKAKHELLLPKGKKTAADKAGSLKHDPMAEFRAAPYTFSDPSSPTFLGMLSTAAKKAMASAALDLPGDAKKAQIGRLTYVHGEMVPVYGKPEVFLSVVRSADMNHTPDVRTRCIVRDWAIALKVSYVTPILNATTVINLLSAAGLYVGIGDWRSQKGSGNYGQFTVLGAEQAANDEHVQSIFAVGREAQQTAMENPVAYNDETTELLSWFATEVKARGKAATA